MVYLCLRIVYVLCMTAILQRINDISKSDWCGMPHNKLAELAQAQTPVEVLYVECEVDGEFEHDYHTIRLPDGEILEGISGYHLKPI